MDVSFVGLICPATALLMSGQDMFNMVPVFSYQLSMSVGFVLLNSLSPVMALARLPLSFGACVMVAFFRFLG